MIYPTLHLKASKMKNLYLLSWLIVLVISGCVDKGDGPGAKECGCGEGKD